VRELIANLKQPNKWFRLQSTLDLNWRGEKSTLPETTVSSMVMEAWLAGFSASAKTWAIMLAMEMLRMFFMMR
jgi:hypothetical protein